MTPQASRWGRIYSLQVRSSVLTDKKRERDLMIPSPLWAFDIFSFIWEIRALIQVLSLSAYDH